MAYVFDLGNPVTNANPFPEFARLRAEDPVHWSPAMKAWIVTRYADVKQVALNNRQISADRLTPFFKTNADYQRGTIESLVRYLNHWMVFRDPPDHTRLRRLFTKAFTPTSVENLRPNIEDIVGHLIDGMEAKAKRGETVDYIADFAYPLPASVIMDLLGVPRADLDIVKLWSDDIALFIGTAQVAGNKYLRAEAGAKAMSGYFRELVEARTAKPTGDMISQLVLARDDRDALSTDEIIGTCILLLFAGHETTTNLIGNGLVTLTQYPGEKQRLIAQPELIKTAVEEMLRFESSNQLGNRMIVEETELGGIKLPAGTLVTLCIGAANRDPAQFPNPENFDVARTPNRHLAFGTGAHQCAGMALARLEGAIAISRFLKRFPNYLLDGEPVRGGRVRFRGFLSVPCRRGA